MIEYLFGLILMFFAFQFVVNLFVKEYTYIYTIRKDNKNYQITEKYNHKNKSNFYTFEVKDQDNTIYNYFFSYNYNKQKGIIKDIEVYNKDNLRCIFPIFKKDRYSTIVCNDNTNTYGYAYLKQIGDKRVEEFENILKQKGYKTSLWDINSEEKTIDGYKTKISYYKKFTDDYGTLIWKYNGVYFINKKNDGVQEVLGDIDLYDTQNHTIAIKENYIIMNIEPTYNEFNRLYVVNAIDGSKDFIDLDNSISSSSYFNGIYKDEAYFTDPINRIQYKVNPQKKKIEIVAQQTQKGKFFDGKKLISKSLDELSKTNLYFEKNIISTKIENDYKTKDIRKSNGRYYFKTNDGNIHLKLDEKSSYDIILFNLQDFREWTVINDTIFGISGDTLYGYNDQVGLKPLVKYSEFNYHDKNMYAVIFNKK